MGLGGSTKHWSNRWQLIIRLVVCTVIVAGCTRIGGCNQSPQGSAVNKPPVTEPAPEVDAGTNYDLNALLAVANPIEGRVLFTQCSACHSLEPGIRSANGPNLYGVFGRQAGKGSYQYSDAFRNAEFVWDVQKLDHWLRDPGAFIQGSRMVFVPIDRPSDRANLIVYLMQQTDAPTAGQAILPDDGK